jgi:hypothetical protein
MKHRTQKLENYTNNYKVSAFFFSVPAFLLSLVDFLMFRYRTHHSRSCGTISGSLAAFEQISSNRMLFECRNKLLEEDYWKDF